MHTANPNLARAELLLNQQRYDLAEPHLRLALAEDPNHAIAHAYLAICLSEAHKHTDATMEARMAVGLAPDDAFTHYVLARVLQHRDMPKESLAAIQEALKLDPSDTRHWSLLSALHSDRKRFKDALAAAEQGLAIDPDDQACLNMRVIALRGLGKYTQAGSGVSEALARNPDSAVAHANAGWNYLHQQKPKPALEHFREALRLDPTLSWARDGMVEALKARYFLYRIFLRYFLFMARMSSKVQWVIILAGYIGYQVFRSLSKSYPALEPWFWPITTAYITFAIGTWLAVPIFNLLLCLNRYGRMVLKPRERRAAYGLGAAIALPILAAGSWLITRDERSLIMVMLLALPIMAVASLGTVRDKLGIWILSCLVSCIYLYVLGMGLVMLLATSKFAEGLLMLTVAPFAITCVGSGWIVNLLNSMRRPAKA